MLEANLAFNWSDLMMHCTLLDEDAAHRPNLLDSYRLFKVVDGWVATSAGTDGQWRGMCVALERTELADHPQLATGVARASNVPFWYEQMDAMIAPFTANDAVSRLVANDVPAAKVLAPDEVVDDAQVQSQASVREITHPIAGRLLQPVPHARFSAADTDLRPAPAHGEHTREVLAEAGMAKDAVDALVAAGVAKA